MQKYTSLKERVSLYFSGLNSYMIVSFASTYLVYFYTDVFLIPTVAVNIIMIVARVWDAINDSIMGIIIDRTRTRIGRMRPYLKYGAIPMALGIILIFIPFNMPVTVKIAYAAITYIAFGMLYTLVDIPLWGLLSIVTPEKSERAALLSTTATIGSVGSVVPMLLIPFLSDSFGDKTAYIMFACFLGFLTFITMSKTAKNTRERIDSPKEKYNFIDSLKNASKNRPMFMALLSSMLACTRFLMQLAAIYIATYVLRIEGLTSGVMLIILYIIVGAGMLIGMIITQPLYKRFGYKAVCIATGIFGSISLFIAYFIGYSNFFVIMPFLLLGGVPLGIYNVIFYPIVGDSLDYLEWKTGNRSEGFCFSLQSFTSKFNQAFAAIALTTTLIIINYVQPEVAGEQASQSESTIKGLYSLVSLLPAIGFALSIIPMLFYNYNGKLREQVANDLESRKKAATEPQALPELENIYANSFTEDLED